MTTTTLTPMQAAEAANARTTETQRAELRAMREKMLGDQSPTRLAAEEKARQAGATERAIQTVGNLAEIGVEVAFVHWFSGQSIATLCVFGDCSAKVARAIRACGFKIDAKSPLARRRIYLTAAKDSADFVGGRLS